MAKGKFEEWLKPEKLEQITNWAINGCTDYQIANNMGITYETLRVWRERFPVISDAVKTGREMSIQCIENMAYKVAMGLVDEESVVKVKDANGGERVEIKKRRMPPNTTMLIFLLKNRAGYRDNPPLDVSADVLERVDSVLRSIEAS